MKPLVVVLMLCGVFCFSTAADRQSATPNPIKPGMTFTDATKILSVAGLSGEKRYYDMSSSEGTAIRYFPLNRNVDLVVTYTEATDQLTRLSLMTSPSYRPVKGLEVYLPLREITFALDGSYTANFAPEGIPK